MRVLALWLVAGSVAAQGDAGLPVEVMITHGVPSVTVRHGGETVVIQRAQDTENTVNPVFAKTSRPCPPFCIQPMQIAPGVETIGELEVLDYLKRIAEGDDSVLVVDSRTATEYLVGTIPGAVSIPWTRLSLSHASEDEVATILQQEFGAIRTGLFWDFSYSKTLVMFCNGMWCGQSPTNIKTLLRWGYPAGKLKWFRGGMQTWEVLGLTTAW
jgi:rhodanese-related sulfurtransferase